MLTLQDISYLHPDKTLLFDHINFSVNKHEKIALIGNNGTGKSTLLKIMAGELTAQDGQVKTEARRCYVPQVFGQYNHLTIAQALRIDKKLQALREILNGNVTENNMSLLDDDWAVEERCHEALKNWQLPELDLTRKLGTLSGGQKTKVFLAGIAIHQPELVLLDEPGNHLDLSGRRLLYDFIRSAQCTLVVVSHDRKLLNLLDPVFELSKKGITVYGGNYDFYSTQKQIENQALNRDIRDKEKAWRRAGETERDTLQRQQRSDARGKRKQEKAGVARIMMNTFRNRAENSTSKIKAAHAEKTENILRELKGLRSDLPAADQMKFGFDGAGLHAGKILFSASEVNYAYHGRLLWKDNLTFQIASGERISLEGPNGAGKTTLIRIMLGGLEPAAGSVYRAGHQSVYVDQDYSLVDNRLTVYEQAGRYNTVALREHEVRTRLSRFLFLKDDWNKPCSALSGGEKMRLMLCCLTITHRSPDIIILDEPTNNLDIQNMDILTAAVNAYHGTLIVVSHDRCFLEQINIGRVIRL